MCFYTYDLFSNVVNCSRVYTSYVGMISKLERFVTSSGHALIGGNIPNVAKGS